MALLTQSQGLIERFQSTELHSSALKSELQARNESYQQMQAHSLDHTVSSADSWQQNMVYSTSDVARLSADVKEHKEFLTQVKFNWSESNVKRRFIQHILVEDSKHDITSAQNAQLERERLEKKAQLKQLKDHAEELRTALHSSAQALDKEIQEATPRIEKAQTLNRSIRGLEVELSTARSSKPQEEQVTITEADAILEDQVNQLKEQSAKLTSSKATLADLQAELARLKQDVTQMEQENATVQRQAAAVQSATQDADGSIQATCQWLATAQSLLKGLIGITAITSPSSDVIQVQYTDVALALQFDVHSFKLTNAHLLDSAQGIDDLVERARASGDIPLLVREVLARHRHSAGQAS